MGGEFVKVARERSRSDCARIVVRAAQANQ